jgi:pimeloyl-ACP methyl ester carboxylesterase
MALGSPAFAQPLDTKKHFPPDPPGTPACVLPDPLVAASGKKLETAEDWKKARPEILELFRKHMYGRVPATPFEKTFKIVSEDPKALDGAATLRQIDVTIAAGGKSLVIRLILFVPNRASKPVPAFLLICNRPPGEHIDPTRRTRSEFWPAEEGIARGYAMAAFYNGDVDPDKNDGFKDGVHGLLDGPARPPDAWGTIAAWAWGASRCLDYLETDKDVASDRVAVIGHSRGGKTALWAGAEDERFAMACSNDSGCGGAALSRRKAKGKETVARITRAFPHWFCETFKSYGDREEALPVDQHMLIALMAPRAVCVGSADQDLWADPRGEFLAAVHAGPVFRLCGRKGLGDAPEMPAAGDSLHGDGVHYHLRAGKHNLTLEDWTAYWDFADKEVKKRR